MVYGLAFFQHTVLKQSTTIIQLISSAVDAGCCALNHTLGMYVNGLHITIHSGKSEVRVNNRNSFCGPLKPVILGDKMAMYAGHSEVLSFFNFFGF